MKKVLIIAYYWPPSGSSAVQRVVKFTKYLPKFGWQPIVLTVDNGQYNAIDTTFEKELPESIKIYRVKSLEPHNIYKIFTGLKKREEVPVDAMMEKKPSWKKRIAFWFRINMFIPDARIGWLPHAVKEGKKIIQDEKIDIIFSTSPPPTVHLIAKKLARWSGLKWVADFRDPWTNIHYLKELSRLSVSQRIDEKLERNVLNSADAIVAVSRYDIKNDYSTKVEDKDKIHYIPNGYDELDFQQNIDPDFRLEKNEKFKIAHIGTVNDDRIPEYFFEALSRLKSEKLISPENFCLYLIGKVSDSAVQHLREMKVHDLVKVIPYLPHPEIFNYYSRMDALLLLTYKSPANIPGKTFEYLRTGKPILMIGNKNGEAARVLKKIKIAKIADYDGRDEIYKHLKSIFSNGKKGRDEFASGLTAVESFSRENLTGKLAKVFDQLITSK
ncbi:hypothetical protein B6D60_08695 [candidate division KSB1 bacterium 4484_87]|nr:MAG: hypothetical protein B6D60_08695 [candidate division KSB1 bacterium 4484_87]